MDTDINISDTICAQATAHGNGAIAIIRVSGLKSIDAVNTIFKPYKGISLLKSKSHTLRFGAIYNGEEILDEVLVSVFRSPHSYTGEDSVEIYCHGSIFIQQEIITQLFSKGVRMAKPGEFSQKAFLNGKMDLTQTEAVADLISSETSASHKVAIQQLRGGFSKELSVMRQSLLDIVSLMELELDFSEEDVEFADRKRLKKLLFDVKFHITQLIESFKLGNVIKNGVPVAIVGATNTGKSTLLNAIIGEDRAIVSEIHGTTRDFIEDVININGVAFRFIDTAGIRQTKEAIEIIGIERTFEKIKSASIVLLMLDAERPEAFKESLTQLKSNIKPDNQKVVVIVNKADLNTSERKTKELLNVVNKDAAELKLALYSLLPMSAKRKTGITDLKNILSESQNILSVAANTTLITNLRHFQALSDTREALSRVEDGLEQSVPTDLLAQDIREALFHIGEIVGEINTEELLGNIFSKFCIGK